MTKGVGWARFGDAGGRHQLLESVGASDEVLEQIRWHTDEPPHATATWKPFFAGYPKNDHYVVQYTKPDVNAERQGMVDSSVVICTLDAVAELRLDDLQQMARKAVTDQPAQPVLERPYQPGLEGVLDLLAERKYAFWVDHQSFDVVTGIIWDLLGAADRATFVFGRLFTPSAIPYPHDHQTLGLFLISDAIRPRFDTEATIDSATPPSASRTSRAILANDNELGAELGIDHPTLDQWKRLAALQEYLATEEPLELEAMRACAHLLGSLSPSLSVGQTPKRMVVDRLKATAAQASFDHIRGLRTIPFSALPDIQLLDIIGPWAQAVAGDPARFDVLAKAIGELDVRSDDILSNALADSLRSEISVNQRSAVDQLAAATAADHRPAFRWLAATARLDDDGDDCLASRLGTDPPIWVHREARAHQLPQTHAASHPLDGPIAAWESHLSLPGQSESSRARLARRFDEDDIVNAALQLGDPSLIDIAGSLAAVNPAALQPPKPTSIRWLQVWAAAVKRGGDPDAVMPAGIAAPYILSGYLAHESELEALLEVISDRDDVELSGYAQRAKVWTAVPEPYRSKLLNRTARVIALRGAVITDLEPALREAICGPSNLAAVAAVDVKAALDVLETCTARGSRSAEAIMNAATLGDHAARFGRIVAKQRWKGAARLVLSRVPRRPDLGPAAEQCRDVLAPLERLLMGLYGPKSAPSARELSEGFAEIAARLYPGGPGERAVWTRAGGDEADVVASRTGREQWHRGLAACTAGSQGAPTLGALLDAMIDDYPNNPDLSRLRSVV